MKLSVPRLAATAHTEADVDRDSRLRGRALAAARGAWLALAILTLGLFAAGVPAQIGFVQTICHTPVCGPGQLNPAELRALRGAGLSLGFYAAYTVGLNVAFALIYALVGAILFWRRSDDRMALLASIALLTFGAAAFTDALYPLVLEHPSWRLPAAAVNFLGSAAFILFLYVFPDARFVPRWMRWPALVWLAQQFLHYFVPSSALDLRSWPYPLQLIVPVALLGTVVYAQVYRYRRVSRPAQREQTKWVVLGITTGLAGFLAVLTALLVAAPRPTVPAGLVANLAAEAVEYACLLLIPISVAIAMLRSRLFDVDLLINRTLVYGTLTLCIAALYVAIVGAFSLALQGRGNLVVSLLATGVVAVAFQPLRERLQRGVNRRMYGQRDEPYAVLSELGKRLEVALAPGAALAVVVETAARALKLPYAAIQLEEGGGYADAASYGTPVGTPLELPLAHQGETVGLLRLGPRATGESWSPADLRLLEDLAHRAGAAAYAVRLTADLRRLTDDLQRSRERIVVAREETRRRLRRDLHDGLAPTLAALALKAGVVGDLVAADPERARALAGELEGEIRATVREIRRLVYELRPPTLDELGLVAAIRERAASMTANGNGGPRVVVEAPERLPPLSAAVEVAAYRITQEALTNVAKHSGASTCTVRLTLGDALEVEIADDGVGIPQERRSGVGLLSMRERAEELGGSFAIETRPEGGTRVWARLPIIAQPKE